MKTLSPEMVNQNNAKVRGNSLLAQARRAYFAGAALPAGVTVHNVATESIGSFEKNYSRQGISDGAFFVSVGTPIFYEQATGKFVYPYCLNYFSTLQKNPTRIVQAVKKVEVIKEKVVYVPSRAATTTPGTTTTTPGTTTTTVDVCTQAESDWLYVQGQYDQRVIKRAQAEIVFAQLKAKYSCLAHLKPHYRNTGLKIATHVAAFGGGLVIGNLTKKNRYRNVQTTTPTTSSPGFEGGNTPRRVNLPPANGSTRTVGFRGGNTRLMRMISGL